MIGGLGTLGGPLIGAFLLTVISELLHGVAVPRLVAYGFLLVIIIIFLRGGIVGGVRMLWHEGFRKEGKMSETLLEVKGALQGFRRPEGGG